MSLYLLRVSFCVRQLGGDMKHNLFIMEICVDRFCPCLPVSDVQPTPKPGDEKEKQKEEIEGQKHEKESE